jgi:hypothetical protein
MGWLRVSACTVLCASITSIVAGADGPDIRHVQSRMMDILLSGALNKELELIDSQIGRLKEIRDERKNSIRTEILRLNDELSKGRSKDGSQLMQKAITDVDKAALDRIRDVLLPFQEQRWNQLALHFVFSEDKAAAFFTPQVDGVLSLTESQKAHLREAFSQGERELKQADMEIRRKRLERMVDMLTPEQREKWLSSFGKPVSVEP